jgi:uncharacterized protein YuzE
MTIRIANVDFDRVNYDEDADVLYLSAGDPARAVDFDESPEGHHLRYDANGDLVGITLVNPRWLLEQDGRVRITLPETITETQLGALVGA